MRTALQVSAFALFAALWALLEWATADVLTRCMVMWTVLAATWLGLEITARTTPPGAAAKCVERVLPAEKPRFLAARRVFAFALGAIFLVAFWSWGSQVRGLVGEHGLIPVSEQLTAMRAAGNSFWQVPSLNWLSAGDTMLLAQCWLGALLAIAMCAGFFPGACALLCWALYLSLMSVGESFGNFQWDALLLETALIAALWLPWRARPASSDWAEETLAQKIGRWLLWWLLVRLMIESGVVKLTWGDETWLGYSALDHHFETQPLPLWTAWYANQAPHWMLRAASWFTYFIEIATPALLLAPPRLRFLRHGTVLLQVLLQIIIMATGNYTYFNWLTIALCVPFLDDTFRGFRRLRLPVAEKKPRHWWRLVLACALALASVCFTFDGFSSAFAGLAGQEAEMRRMREGFQRTGKQPAMPWLAALRSFNGYGLFRTMTLSRPEFILEGSDDGVNWHEYEFPYKAGDIYRRPALVAPFQPRLDWQMWFAALSPQHYSYLLERLMRRVLEGDPAVLALLEKNPFPNHPPRFVRLSLYDYHFTRFGDQSAAWWKRELRGTTQPLSLENFRPRATQQ
ncbi:MAG: lipase maturation factor family protein [Chthoniobacteraceae bacterium]